MSILITSGPIERAIMGLWGCDMKSGFSLLCGSCSLVVFPLCAAFPICVASSPAIADPVFDGAQTGPSIQSPLNPIVPDSPALSGAPASTAPTMVAPSVTASGDLPDTILDELQRNAADESDEDVLSGLEKLKAKSKAPTSTPSSPPESKPSYDQLLECLQTVADKPTCPKGFDRLLDLQALCFDFDREEAKKKFYKIVVAHNKGEISDDEFRSKMKEWFDDTKLKFVNCGERAKLSSAVAAWLGYTSYDCSRKDGDHEFAIVVIDGQWYLVEPWPGQGNPLIGPIKVIIDGESKNPPLDSLDGATLKNQDGEVLETIGSCNMISKGS